MEEVITMKSLKLRTQLSLSFAMVIGLLVVLVGIAYWRLESMSQGFAEYRCQADNAKLFGKL
ncbi:MAG TPA: hypothetical protein DIC59_14885 [Candidatus Competibacteraceae bacterium]|nr:hypothetical protein [Candidatus Competibacteraceae bacterium]